MSPKLRVQITPQQKLEYAKMMVEDGYTNQQIQDISGACSSAVVRWKRQYKEEMLGMTPTNRVALTPEQQRIQELEKQLARAKRDIDIFKKSQRLVHTKSVKPDVVRKLKKAHPTFTISELCRVLGVASSCFYYTRVVCSDETTLHDRIYRIAEDSDFTYGKRRIHRELVKSDVKIGLAKVSRLMKAIEIPVKYPKKRHRYNEVGEESIYAPNILKRQFTPETHNTHWGTDVTYIRSHQGWSYLACVLDLATKEVVGYSLSRSPDTNLTLAALDNAIQKRRADTTQLLLHSDQGCHFSSRAYRHRLQVLNITQSMSKRGCCWDNAVMERFFRSLKSERLNELSFINHQSIVMEVESYIRFYNYKRSHSGIDYLTPNEKYQQMQKVA
ncbi:IS3 family transposase [Vibrio aestuarianus]|uniref:IS3 family transposase n=1 Tax=Vibrio aestuarianus TaxID=28171 RepID=A0A9X4J3W9_9VIBR|nr:IS3-like element ISVa4 family transposase [Vibrio aestuarianus]MDE1311801.1 IS3 family transposase [Vibrio aestuarianus]MDE1312034.1 IS3 family transposase [Vibrio aestuarianus]MDE1358354.1 IS3 family transposase [Vibrio aestuarianus]